MWRSTRISAYLLMARLYCRRWWRSRLRRPVQWRSGWITLPPGLKC